MHASQDENAIGVYTIYNRVWILVDKDASSISVNLCKNGGMSANPVQGPVNRG
jgi:hypothetical protein